MRRCHIKHTATRGVEGVSIIESASVMHYTCETRVVWRRRAVIVNHRVWLRGKRERQAREVLNDVDLYPLSTLPRSARALLHQYPAVLPFFTVNVPTPCFRPAVLKIRLCESRGWLVQLAISRQSQQSARNLLPLCHIFRRRRQLSRYSEKSHNELVILQRRAVFGRCLANCN